MIGVFHLFAKHSDLLFAFVPVDGYSADTSEEPSERKSEQFLFHQKMNIQSEVKFKDHTIKEIPVAGMRSANDDTLFQIGQLAIYFPTRQKEERICQ